jgi:DNA-directed RNA polymerase subunit E'/Rpb7
MENIGKMETQSKENNVAAGPQTPEGPPPDLEEDFVPPSPDYPPPDLEPKSPDEPPPDFVPPSPDDPPPDLEEEKGKSEAISEAKNDNKNDTKKKKQEGKKHVSIYSHALIHKKIPINMVHIGKNIKQTLEKIVAQSYEGKCIVEGYIKPGSTQVISYSSGIVKANSVLYEVVFDCLACFPVEGMLIQAIAKNITKAGIRAESADETPSPLIIFVARDHHYSNAAFSKIKEGDRFLARVIGQRFELNDPYVSVIAEYIDPSRNIRKRK